MKISISPHKFKTLNKLSVKIRVLYNGSLKLHKVHFELKKNYFIS